MDSNILAIIVGAVALIIGIVSGKFIFAKDTSRKVEEARRKT
jgi:ribonucrease Y